MNRNHDVDSALRSLWEHRHELLQHDSGWFQEWDLQYYGRNRCSHSMASLGLETSLTTICNQKNLQLPAGYKLAGLVGSNLFTNGTLSNITGN